MNEDYVKGFVENFKRKFADVVSVNVELETLLAFKDREIEELKGELAKFKPADAPVDAPAK